MKKFLLSLVLVAFATSINAQTVGPVKQEVKKECCKEHKDGQQCNKPADQQCPDCKAKAAQGQCDKAQMKGECKKAAQGQCDKAQMKGECKKAAQGQCDKAQMKGECKKAAQGQCDKAQMKGECKKAAQGQCDKAQMKKDCCKDKKMEGKKCDKPADQQCPDCKEKAKKN